MNRHFLSLVGLCLALALIGAASAQAVDCTGKPAWTDTCNMVYTIGNQYTYQGSLYQVRQTYTNTCGAGWTPAAVGSLWSLVGTCTTGATATATTARATPTPTNSARATATATTARATATPTSSGSGGSCAAAWVSTVQYCAGAKVSVSGNNYTAAFCSQGSNPTTNNGPSGSGQPWLPPASCTQATATATTPPTPTPTTGSGCTSSGGSAPYNDISLATGSQVAANAASAGLHGITLAFLVDGGCQATWGGGLGNVSNAMFPNGTSVSSAVSSLTGAGRKVYISWGGAAGSALSSCGTASGAQTMYQQAFTAYPSISGQDFDIEGGVNATTLCQALAGLHSANSSKTLSLTLPVLPTGLVSAGVSIVNACHSDGLHLLVNVMAMDYGTANDNGGNMLLSAEQSGSSTRSQTGDPIGITPMIGLNDNSAETFKLTDASGLVSWAKGQSYVQRLAFWSLSRDNGGCAGQTFASPTCSGVAQSTWQFSSIFNGF